MGDIADDELEKIALEFITTKKTIPDLAAEYGIPAWKLYKASHELGGWRNMRRDHRLDKKRKMRESLLDRAGSDNGE